MSAPYLLSPAVLKQGGVRLAELLPRAATQFPDSGVYSISGESKCDAAFLGYPGLLEEAQHILGGLHEAAGHPETKVVLLLERSQDFIPAFWACILGGYVPCPLASIRTDQERWARHLAHIDALLDRPLFVSTGRVRHELLPSSVICAELEDLRTSSPNHQVHQATLSDVAILVLTSGSTGNSKAVALTHGNLLASMAGKSQRQQLTSADVTLNWISFDHVAALLEAHLLPLYVGATQVHVESAAILADPLLFLRLIDRFRITMSFSPNFLLAQINSALQSPGNRGSIEERLALDLASLRHIVSGGEAIVVETGRRFLDLLAPYGLPRNALWPAFGMTETCAGSVYSREFPERDADHEFACLGLPINGLQMRIADDYGNLLPDGQPGELQLRGPMIFSHYYNSADATSAAFTVDGWFRSGDVGRIDDGRLALVGRTKDSIVVSGVNYFSHELEATLEQLNGIARSFVAVFPTRPKGADTEQLVVTFATDIRSNEEERLYQLVVAVRNTTIMLWGFRPAQIVPLPKGAFPKTSLGKILRGLMRKRLEAGGFGAHVIHIAHLMSRQLGSCTPPEGPLETAIAEVFSAILRVDIAAISTTASFFDLGGTSLDILKLTETIERRFELKPALPIVLQNPTVRRLAACISSASRYEGGEYHPIVPMQVTGGKTPLFCIHPGNGEVLIFVNLAKYFVNERPFYALRPRGFDVADECFTTLEEMVSTYLDAIIEIQPRGPYALAGYSLGCAIAFEIAKRIEARGERVAFLGCIDGYPSEGEPALDWVYIATGLAALLDLIDWKQAEELSGQLRGALADREPCEYVVQAASRERLAELDLDLPKFSAWARVAQVSENIIRAHVSSDTVRTMSVFCSAGFPLFPTKDWHSRLRRWNNFVRQLRYVDVPGEHYTLMGPKHVAAFQDVLRAELNLALEGK